MIVLCQILRYVSSCNGEYLEGICCIVLSKMPSKWLLFDNVFEHYSRRKPFSAEQTTLCPQLCMKQQSAWLLNHISAHPIKQWRTKLGPKSRHKAHSWAIESVWLHSFLHHTHHWSRILEDSINAQCGIHQLITFLSMLSRPALHADVKNPLMLFVDFRFLPLTLCRWSVFCVGAREDLSTSRSNALWGNYKWAKWNGNLGVLQKYHLDIFYRWK